MVLAAAGNAEIPADFWEAEAIYFEAAIFGLAGGALLITAGYLFLQSLMTNWRYPLKLLLALLALTAFGAAAIRRSQALHDQYETVTRERNAQP